MRRAAHSEVSYPPVFHAALLLRSGPQLGLQPLDPVATRAEHIRGVDIFILITHLLKGRLDGAAARVEPVNLPELDLIAAPIRAHLLSVALEVIDDPVLQVAVLFDGQFTEIPFGVILTLLKEGLHGVGAGRSPSLTPGSVEYGENDLTVAVHFLADPVVHDLLHPR